MQVQPAVPQTVQTAAPAQAAQAAAAKIAQPPATAQIATAATTPPTTGNPLDQLQALNNALSALGLNDNDIQTVDRIAALLNDFSPVAYSSLVHQLEALALQAAPQTAPQTPAATAGSATTGSGTSANNGGFQVQELLIKFNGVQGTVNTGATNAAGGAQQSAGGNTTGQFSAFNLQVQDIQLTLANNSGQTLHVQAPNRQNTDGDHGDRQSIQERATAA